MTPAAFVAAFGAGALSLLSPCSALLLPAFFAYAFVRPTELFARTLLFLLGVSVVLVPLGMGASLIGALLIDHRQTTVLVAGLLLIGFGVMELSGHGFSLLPTDFAERFRRGGGIAAVIGTGVAYGISGFCAGPLVGSVLTLAATAGDLLAGGALLFVYSLGAAAPLFLLAWLWDRFQLGRRGWLRGGAVRFGPLTVHTTNLIAGAMLILLGGSFIAFQGASALSGFYDDLGLTDLGFAAQEWLARRLG